MIERRLRETGVRLRRLREELAVVEEQLGHLQDDAEDKALRSLMSETAGSGVEYREARLHAEAMKRHREVVQKSIVELEAKQDELLDKMNQS